jgi:hypothetical protein
MAVMWRDKKDIHMMINIYNLPAEGNFCDEKGNAIQPHIVERHNHHIVYVDKGDRMASSYSISCHTWKWTKKLFFYLLDMSILKSYIFLCCVVERKSHIENFGLPL